MSNKYGHAIERDTWAKHGERPSVKDFGALGDTQRLSVSTTASSAEIVAVASAGAGTISSSGRSVTGSGTSFFSDLQVGNWITADGQSRKVVAILSDTAMVTESAFSPSLSADSYTVAVGFEASDVGKRFIIFGAGGVSGRESMLREYAAGQNSTDSWVIVSGLTINTQGATNLKIAGNSGLNDVEWEVFGSNTDDFASETSVHGPEDLEAAAASVSFSDATPDYAYYRVKIRSKVTGNAGVAYITAIVLGRVLGTTIASVESASQCTLADAASTTVTAASAYFGTDDTEAIQAALDTGGSFVAPGTADGGMEIQVPRGIYLISDQIFHRRNVVLRGHSAGGSTFLCDAAAFPDSVAVWNMTGTFGSDGRIAFFTRLEDVRLDCSHVPGSIGIFCDALQENSGLYRVTVVQWLSTGVQVGSVGAPYGCANWMVEDLWVYPSLTCFLSSSAVGFKAEYALDTTIRRCTILAQGGYICGYGKAIYLSNSSANIQKLHCEAADIGVHFDAGSAGVLDHYTGQYFVHKSVQLDTTNPIQLRNISKSGGKYALVDNICGRSFEDYFLSPYDATALPARVRGANAGPDIQQWIPGTATGGKPAVRINRRGVLMTDGGDPTSPNIIGLVPLNFGGTGQGGWIGINAEMTTFPYWVPTSGWRFTADAATDTLTLYNEEGVATHSLSNDATVEVGSSGSGAALPSGLASSATYYVISANQSAGTLQLSTTLGGSAVPISTAGTGTHYISKSLAAAWVRLGASKMEYRTGRVPNDGGTDPGTEIFEADASSGFYTPWNYFSGTDKVLLGNKLGVHRLRLYHGETGQNQIILERSSDSGGSWANGLIYNIADDQLLIPGLTASRPVKTDASKKIVSGKISVTEPNDVDVSGLTDGSLVKRTGNALASLTISGTGFVYVSSGVVQSSAAKVRLDNDTDVSMTGKNAGRVAVIASGGNAIDEVTDANLVAQLENEIVTALLASSSFLNGVFDAIKSNLKDYIVANVTVDISDPTHGHTVDPPDTAQATSTGITASLS